MKALTSLVLGLGLLFSVAHAETSMGWPDGGALALSEAEAKEVSSEPLFKKRLGRVSLNLQNWKFSYDNFTDPLGVGRSHVERRMQEDFLNFLKNQFYESGIFPAEVKDRLALKVTLLHLKHESSVGASAEARNPVTSGAVMTTKVSMRYELVDQETVVGAWEINTSAKSNSLNAGTRLADSTDIALKRNLRSLLLRLIADLSPENNERATRALATLGTESDDTRSLMGYVLLGVGKTANATSSAAWGVMTFMAENSDTISAGLDSTTAQLQRNNQEFNQARTQALLDSRQQSNSQTKPAQGLPLANLQPSGSGAQSSAKRSTSTADTNSVQSTTPPVQSTLPRTASSTVVASQASSGAGSNSSIAATDRPFPTKPLSRYTRDWWVKADGSTRDQACLATQKLVNDKSAMPYNFVRVLSTGSCECKDGVVGINGAKLWPLCSIKLAVEVEQDSDPNEKSVANPTPNSNTSR